MPTTYTYFQQDNAVDSWIVEEFDDNNQPVSTYVVFDDPNVKPSIQNIKKISAESADFSGSLLVTGSVRATAGFTGSLHGTASFATNADAIKTIGAGSGTWYPLMQAGASTGYLTPAFSTLFSFNGGTGVLNVTSSRAVSSSFASTASYAQNAQTASYVQNAISSSFATTASYATVAQNVLNESSFALLGSPNTFTSNQTITAKLSQGNSTTVGTTKAYSCGISSGVVTLSAVLYGDVTADFNVDDQLVIYDYPFDSNYGIITSKIASVTYDSFVTLSTIITLYDTSIGTTTAYVGDLSVGVANWNGDQTIPADYSHAEGVYTVALGDYSHAEGNSTTALGSYSHAEGNSTTAAGVASHAEGNNTVASGDYSHAEGNSTVAAGAYQHVQGQYNLSSSAQSAFIVGNGTSDATRSNLIFASGSQVHVTGSLIVSGSGTFTNIGPAVFSGSVASTAGFTGSLQGTATTASYVATAQTASFVLSSSFAQTASFVKTAQTASFVLSSSFAQTASFVKTAQTASFVNPLTQTVQITGSLIVSGSSTFTGTQTLSGSLIFATPTSPAFNGEIVRFGSGTLTTGQLYFLSSSGTWSLANANSTGSSTGMLGIATGTSPTTAGLLVRGYAASSSYTTATGSIVYAATSSGLMTTTSPSSSNHVVRVVGYVTTIPNTIYFAPDPTFVTLA